MYSKKALYIVLCLFLFNSNLLFSQWTWQIVPNGQELWVKSYYNNIEMFDYKFGGGGCIDRMRNCQLNYQDMLSPSFQGENTDRVMQWVYWGLNVSDPNSTASDKRYNMDQAGNFAGQFAEVMKVIVYPGDTIIDIYSLTTKQWYPVLDQSFSGKIPSITRYVLKNNGTIQVTKHIRSATPYYNNVLVSDFDLYLEQWLPFRRDAFTFTGLAFGIDNAGAPNWWYQAGNNIPQYPGLAASSGTNGYAMVYRIGGHDNYMVSSIVFGKQDLQLYSTTATGTHNLNSMDWVNGIGVLPSITVNDVEPSSVLSYQFYIVPGNQSDAAYASLLNSIVPSVDAPTVYGPTYPYSGKIQNIKQALDSIENLPGYATDMLVPYLYNSPTAINSSTKKISSIPNYTYLNSTLVFSENVNGILQVVDITGKTLINTPINSNSTSITHLNPGVYLFTITRSDENRLVGKFIVN